MKIGWETISWLVRDAVQKEKPSLPQSSLPERLIAQVKESGKELAVLRWEGRTFTARIDVPVKKGEYLLLQFKGTKEGKLYYKVQARSYEPFVQEGTRHPTQHLLLQNSHGMPFPLIYRSYEKPEEKQEENRSTGEAEETPVFDLIIETRNLGFIILRLSRKQGIYYLCLLVESEEQGRLLHESLETLQQSLLEALQELSLNVRMKPWELLSPAEKQETRSEMFKVSHLLDERV